ADSGRGQLGGEAVDILTPTGGESVTKGTIWEWSGTVGETVKDGDTVVAISTDKVDMELPAPASGTITEILFEEGATVTVGQVIARMTTGDAAAPSGEAAAPTAPAEAAPAEGAQAPGDGTPASPVARRVAADQGVDISGVEGTARGGRGTKADVRAAAGRGG